MTDTWPLKKLLDYAQKQNDDSVKKLGRLNLHHQEAEKKLNLLLQYRQNYQDRLQKASQNGIDQIEWRNFITFINKLDAAITEQRLAVKHAENNRNEGNGEYLSSQRKLNSYETLSQRYQHNKRLIQKKVEQKELDEVTSNRYARNISNPKK